MHENKMFESRILKLLNYFILFKIFYLITLILKFLKCYFLPTKFFKFLHSPRKEECLIVQEYLENLFEHNIYTMRNSSYQEFSKFLKPNRPYIEFGKTQLSYHHTRAERARILCVSHLVNS